MNENRLPTLLVGIVIIQAIAIGLLLTRPGSSNSTLLPSEPITLKDIEPVPASFVDPASIEHSSNIDLTGEQLRRIVREETSLALHTFVSQKNTCSTESSIAQTARKTEQTELVSEINNQIEYYLNDGEFSKADLVSLETELMKLDADERRQVSKKLRRSLNELKINYPD